MKSRKGFLWSATFMVFYAYAAPNMNTAAAAEALQVRVAGLKANDAIPQRFAYNRSGCAGENISPEISWSGVPASAKSLALVVWDQDAPVSGGFYHWAILNLPAATKKLPEGAGDANGRRAPAGSVQLVNDWGDSGYGGPCPPGHSQHRYHFILYALGVEQLPVTARTKISEAAAQLKKNAMASAEVVLVFGH